MGDLRQRDEITEDLTNEFCVSVDSNKTLRLVSNTANKLRGARIDLLPCWVFV